MRFKALALLAGVLGAVAGFAAPVSADVPAWRTRYAGTDRYQTAAIVAGQVPVTANGTVVIATGENWPDALAVGPAAAAARIPLLLTQTAKLPVSTADELKRRKPAQIMVVGGPGAVSATVTDALGKLGFPTNVVRLAGPDRYATALAVAQQFFPNSSAGAFVVNGQSYQHALVGSARGSWRGDGGPLLFTSADGVLSDAAAAQAAKAVQTRIIGGSDFVTDTTAEKLAAAKGKYPTRINAADVYTLSANAFTDVAAHGALDAVILATADGYADALAGASLGHPLMFAKPGCVPAAVNTAISRLDPNIVVLLGGTGVLGAGAERFDICP